MDTKKGLFILTLVVALSLLISPVLICAAEDYPSRSLKMIVPFGAGGGNDVACRFLAKYAGDIMDKTVIVENMPGAGGMKGQAFVAKAKPDGYTILGYSSSVIKNSLMKTPPYHYSDFATIAMYCYDPEVLIVPAASPFKNLDEFLQAAKTKGVSINTSGHGSGPHTIALMVLAAVPDLKFRFVHAESGALQVQQLLGSHVDGGFMSVGEASSQIETKALRPLAVSTTSRIKDYPELPTFKEKGIDIVYGAVRGVAVSAKTPKDRIDYLDKLFGKVINDQKFIDAMTKAGFPVEYRNSKDFTEYMNDYAVKFAKIIPMLEEKK